MSEHTYAVSGMTCGHCVASVPTAGSYRLFLDVQHGGVVRTAAFTVATGPVIAAPAAEAATPAAPAAGHTDGSGH